MPKRNAKQLLAPQPEEAQPSGEESDGISEGGPEGSATSSDSAVTDGSGSGGEGADSDAETSMSEEVEVDIEFFNPKESDFHGVRSLVQGLLGGGPFDASGLADAVINQGSVGTVVKSGEEEEPIGFTSALSLKRYAELEAVQQVKAHLLQQCPDAATRQQLVTALKDAGTGLILNERVVNCPPQISPPLMLALFDEIGWAMEDEPTKELQDSFRFSQFLLIAPAYRDPAAPAPQPEKPAKKKIKRPSGQQAEAQLVYTKPEDEFFHRNAEWSFSFEGAPRAAAATPADAPAPEEELQPLRLVMLVTLQQAAEARKELDEVIGKQCGASQWTGAVLGAGGSASQILTPSLYPSL